MSSAPIGLAEFDTGTLCESGAQPLEPGLRPLWPCGRIVGPARTACCPSGENLMLHRAVAAAARGEVIVARCGDAAFGYWGEVLAEAALARGVAGLVIGGSVRDAEAIRAAGLPVFALGTALPGTGKGEVGSSGEPLELLGAHIRPGDVVVADESGVVVVPADAIDDVRARARARNEAERDLIARLRDGATTLELLGLAPRGA